MINNTYLTLEKYNIADTGTLDFDEKDVSSFIKYTLFESSSVTRVDIVASTYGKYSNEEVNLTEALLEEHKAERDREDNT